MWMHIPGMEKPPEMQKITEDERKARDRKRDKTKTAGKVWHEMGGRFLMVEADDQAQPHMMYYCRPWPM